VDRDIVEAGLRVRNPVLLRRWLAATAAATSSTASFETLRDAATAGTSDKPARSTTTAYQDALQRIWITDPVPAWRPGHNYLRRLTLSSKHQLADPALAVAATGLTADDLLDGRHPDRPVIRDGTFLGALFESLVTLSVRVFAQHAEAEVFHLRTRGGEHEVDLIVRGPGGRILALEVKLTEHVRDDDVRHLLWLKDQIGPDLTDAAVVTTGSDAYRRPDGIAVVPAALLGP
jgi:predicted AAA+ superfamily ATPase